MLLQKILRLTLQITAAALIAASAACAPAPAPAQPTAPVLEPTLAVPTTPVMMATATTAPTETNVPTVTAIPTSTPEPTATQTATPTLGPSAESSLTGWCLPEGVSTAYIEDVFTPYPDSRMLTAVKDLTNSQGAYEIRNLPAAACVFVYQFNQPAPDGLTLAVYEQNGTEPWLTAPLKPVEGKPEAAAAVLTHAYIITIPTWTTSYRIAVKDAGGAELRSDILNLNRWMPELCWNGALPDINTLRCPLQQDLHPWDAGYGTPMPTAKPEG